MPSTWRRRSAALAAAVLGALLAGFGEAASVVDEEQAAARFHAQAMPLEEGLALVRLGSLYASQGQLAKARDDLGRALPLLHLAGQSREEARTLVEYWAVRSRLDGKPEGFPAIGNALTLQHALGDREGEAASRSRLGWLYAWRGDRRQARRETRAAVAAFRAAADRRGEARAELELARLDAELGRLPAAVAEDRRALALFTELGDPAGSADALAHLAQVQLLSGQAAAARDADERALALFTAQGREREAGEVLNGLGSAYRAAGDLRRALALDLRAQQLNHRLGERGQEATSWNDLGKTYAALGETEPALDAYDQALALFRSLGEETEAEGVTLANLGRFHRDIGQLEKALHELERSLHLLRQSPYLAAAMADFGVVLGRCHQNRDGIPWLQGALVLERLAGNEQERATTLNNLARIYYYVGERDASRRFSEEALAAYRTLGETDYAARVEVNLAELDLAARPKAAVARLTRAIPVLAAAGDRSNEANGRLIEVRARRLLGDLPGARQALDAALSRIESLRREPASPQMRAAFLASRQEFYRLDVELWMEQHRREPGAGFAARAFAASERGKARSLVDLLAEAGGDLTRGVPRPLLAEEAELGRQVKAAGLARRALPEPAAAARDQDVESLLDRYERVEARIRRASPEAALALPRLLDAREAARLLDRDTLLLEYALGDERSFLFVLSGEGLAASLPLPPRRDIEAAARQAAGLLPSSAQTLARAETRAALAELSRLLLAPAAPWLAGKRLAIVPDGALHAVPFGALPDPADRDSPLLAGHEIVTLPSASALATQRERLAGRRPAPGTVAVVADPVFDLADPRVPVPHPPGAPGRYPRLLSSGDEARAILSVAPPPAGWSAVGFAASRETVLSGRLARYRIVHFATHAQPDAEHPELYEIVLSLVDREGKPVDGHLPAHEIYHLHLPAELVVLSACQTALGREVAGEGPVGLTRAFQYAGARRVLVSLWPVDDRATAELMRSFYQGLLVRHLAPAAALRQAQLALLHLKGWESPYYWAGFILSGDWRPAP